MSVRDADIEAVVQQALDYAEHLADSMTPVQAQAVYDLLNSRNIRLPIDCHAKLRSLARAQLEANHGI